MTPTEPDEDGDQFADPHGAAVAELLARDACAHAHGIETLRIAPGHAQVAMTVRADMLNPHRTCHGGILFLLGDTALGLASNAPDVETGDAALPTVTTSATITYTKAAREGDRLVATAAITHDGSRSGVFDVSIVRADDEQSVALFRGNTLRLPQMKAD